MKHEEGNRAVGGMSASSHIDSSLLSMSTIIFLLVSKKGIRSHAASLQDRRIFLGSHCSSFGWLLYVSYIVSVGNNPWLSAVF